MTGYSVGTGTTGSRSVPRQDLLIGGNGTGAGIDSDPGTFRFPIEGTS